MLRTKFPGRLFHQQDLAIDFVIHGVPSLAAASRSCCLMLFLVAVERAKKRSAAHIVRCGRRWSAGMDYTTGTLWQTRRVRSVMRHPQNLPASEPPELTGVSRCRTGLR